MPEQKKQGKRIKGMTVKIIDTVNMKSLDPIWKPTIKDAIIVVVSVFFRCIYHLLFQLAFRKH